MNEIPTFIKIFLIGMSLYHSLMYSLLREISIIAPSRVWNYLKNGNYFGIPLTFATFLLLNTLYQILPSKINILIFIAMFDLLTHCCANLATYYVIKPIGKEKIKLSKTEYLALYILSPILLIFTAVHFLNIKFPLSSNFNLLIVFLLFSASIVLYAISILATISKSYAEIGFVSRPFFVGAIGMLLYLLSVSLMIFLIYTVKFEHIYYNISLYAIFFIFTILYFIIFSIEYPSLLQKKWKALMPFDIVKVAFAATLAFLAASIYYTIKETPKFAMYLKVFYPALLAALFVIFIAVTLVLAYIKLISENSELKYWDYIRTGLFIHLVVTFYVLALTALVWSEMTFRAKLISIALWLIAFIFYLFYAMDLRTVIKDLDIPAAFDRLDIVRYFVSLYSVFFLIFFGISFTYGKEISLPGSPLEYSPVILFFIAVFLAAFTTYLSVTHKGLEELMKLNIWSELSYIASFGTFIAVYFLYRNINLKQFPFHDIFFIAYFVTLVIEIASVRTLGVESKYRKRKDAIQDLLNYHTSAWLRTDYLQQVWERVVDKYEALSEELTRIRFNPSLRGFDLKALDENTRATVAVALLLEMYKIPDLHKITITGSTYEDIKKEIEEVLKQKILLLPEELRTQFEEKKYYAALFEKCVYDITEKVETFIPAKEHDVILKKLSRVNPFFQHVALKTASSLEIKREEFVHYFKKYIGAIEAEFPFQYTLLYDAVKEEIADVLCHYGFTVEDILDIVPTGFKLIDNATDGGLIKRTSTLLVSEETKKKNEILASFALRGLRDKDYVVYVTSKRPSGEILDLMAEEDLTRLVIIDLHQDIYTQNPVKEVLENESVVFIPANTTLFQHSIVKTIKRYPREAHKRVILDTYADLLKYYEWERLYEILQKQLAGLRKWNCTTIITLDQNLIPPSEFEKVKKRFDNVVILSGSGREASATIQKLYGGTPQKRIIPLELSVAITGDDS